MSDTITHSQTLAANDKLHREMKTGLCGVLQGYSRSRTGLEIADCFEQTMALYYSTGFQAQLTRETQSGNSAVQ